MKKGNFVLATALIISHGISGIAWGNNFGDKVEQFAEQLSDKLDQASESFNNNVIQKVIGQVGDNTTALQDYFDHYQWQGIIENEATCEMATLSGLTLEGHSRFIIAMPGQEINAQVKCALDKEKCSYLSMYRVLLGFKGQGVQTAIASSFGALAGESEEKFVLHAPSEPGLYEIRFKPVKGFLESDALKKWND